MSDDRWTEERDAEANGQGARPYLDRRPFPGRVRRAANQPDRRGPPSPEEIQAFIAQQFPETQKPKKKLERPPGWDEQAMPEADPAEEFDR